jgi:hypothetical protein
MYISIYYAKKKSSLLLRLPTKKTKRHNIADTTPSKEDELIKEQNLSQLAIHKRAKTLSRSNPAALFSRNELSRNRQ